MNLDPGVYHKAAELISNGNCDYSCTAIKQAIGVKARWNNKHINTFTDHFYHSTWKVEDVFWNEAPTPKRQELRVLALCFMAAIVEAGDA